MKFKSLIVVRILRVELVLNSCAQECLIHELLGRVTDSVIR